VRYPLQETTSTKYPPRTARNVRDSDATLILTRGTPDRGTALTARLAERYRKPHLVLDLTEQPSPAAVRTWAESHAVRVLNVAGPRESSRPGIYPEAVAFLRAVLCGPDGC
jgi:hypothetical protein